ncbi:MAG TPA: hypothetical protein VGE77_06860 [Nocardioides sp.]
MSAATIGRRVALLGPWVVAALLVACGVYAFTQADGLRSTPAAENHALVDATGTAEVQAAATQTLTRVLSYDHAAPEATTAAADELLRGAAREEFDVLYGAHRGDGPRARVPRPDQPAGGRRRDDRLGGAALGGAGA